MEKTVGLLTMEKIGNRTINSVGSSRIRGRWLLPYWEEAEEFIVGKKYDVLIFQKVYWQNILAPFDGIKIMDLCDPDWLENRPVFEYIDQMDGVVTSTEPLAEYIRKVRPNAFVRCIADRVYLPESEPVKTEHSEKIQTVVWFGYSQNSHYLFRTLDELVQRKLNLVIVSDDIIDVPYAYRDRIEVKSVPYSYDTANAEMVKHDAVLLPEPFGDERAKYKSNNKVVQAWSLGMPVIRMPEDFDRLATKEAREEESKAKRLFVEKVYDVKISVDEYKYFIQQIQERKNSR